GGPGGDGHAGTSVKAIARAITGERPGYPLGLPDESRGDVIGWLQLEGSDMSYCSRRNFLKAGLAAGVLAKGGFPLRAARGTATDWVTLGRSGVKVTRLA